MQTSAQHPLPPGAINEGECYAGVVVDKSGKPLHHLILLPAQPPIKRLNWDVAAEWATSVGGSLPTLEEGELLRENLQGDFEDHWYWSATPRAGDSTGIWFEIFGLHGGVRTMAYEGRACAIRREPIALAASTTQAQQ